MSNQPPRIGVCLLTFNSLSYVDRALDSVMQQTYRASVVVAVDNASTDDSVRALLAWGPVLEAVEANRSNVGYAAGMNQGFRWLVDCDLVIPMNADVVLDRRYFELAAQTFASDPTIGVIGGRLCLPSGAPDVGALVLRPDARVRSQSLDVSRFCFKVSGAAPVFRSEALEDVVLPGGMVFDEHFDTYVEDIDLAVRLLRRGWRTWFLTEMTGIHHRSASSDRRFRLKPSRLRRNIVAGRYSVVVRYFPLPAIVVALPILAVEDLAIVGEAVLSGRWTTAKDVCFSWIRVARALAIDSAVRRRVGPMSIWEFAEAMGWSRA